MTPTRRSDRSRLAIALIVLCLAGTSAASKQAEDAQGTQETGEDGGDPVSRATAREFRVPSTVPARRPEGAAVGLEALLQLPKNFVSSAPRVVAGAVESEWRRRFAQADLELSEASTRLKDTKRELDGIASESGSSQWSIAPPGTESSRSTSPLSFKLRQQIRDDRERITVSEKALRGLRIEADLAGVPQSWRVVKPIFDPHDPGLD